MNFSCHAVDYSTLLQSWLEASAITPGRKLLCTLVLSVVTVKKTLYIAVIVQHEAQRKSRRKMATTAASKKATINHSLVRKLLLCKHPKQRVSLEAVELTAELLRFFILDAKNRASVEVSMCVVFIITNHGM